MTVNKPVWNKLPKLAAKLAALDQAPVASLWVDASGAVGYFNELFLQNFGYHENELNGIALDRLIPALGIEQWQQEWWELIENERYIPIFPLSWRHCKGIRLEYTSSVSRVDVSGLSFAAFYLWPKQLEKNHSDSVPNSDVVTVLQSLGESVCLLDDFGVIRFANPAFCKLVGGKEADLLGVSLLEIISPAKSHLTKVWNVLRQKRCETECEFENLAGKSLHVRMTSVPLQSRMPDNASYLVSFVDITEQMEIARKLEAQNASYERLASNVPGFIYKFRMTPEGVFSFPYASRGCKEIFGVDPSLVENDATPIVHTIHPDDFPGFQSSVLDSAIHLSPWNFEARQITANGEWKWFHAASRPQLQDNGDIIWEGLVMDVTDRKRTEEELAKAKLAAEASARAKAEFLANMSHEIRTPLNAIIGLNRLVLKSELNDVQRDYLHKVQMSSENLLGIINNILDFSKIESGKLDVEHVEFNLDAVLENIGAMLEPVAAEKRLELLIDRGVGVPLYMVGDSLRLVQVLTNLCSNAIKFTSQGEIVISVKLEGTDRLRFSVRDTGIGLSEKQKSRIFESFTQADSSTTRNFGGTGLGLTISKHLVELMGGELDVDSVEGIGSDFNFSLPLNVVPDNREIDSVPPELEGWHVLLICQNETACGIFETMLHDLRFKVTLCSLGKMKLHDILRQQQESDKSDLELVLLDWTMSESDRADIIEALENDAFGSKTPIIVNISSLEAENIKKISQRFANITLLNKPSTPSCLMDAILNACGKETVIESFKNRHDSANTLFYEASVRGIRILVVEDNEINQEVVRKTLEGAGVDVDIACNGLEAVSRLRQCADEPIYDAVLMDLQMPEMDGYAATAILRKDPRFDRLPIIAMTAHTIESDRQQCLAVGMQDHIGKPIDLEQLFSKLARWTVLKQDHEIQADVDSGDSPETGNAPEKSLTALETVNVKSALRLLQDDEALLLKLLLKFASEQRDVADLIAGLVAEGKAEKAAEKAHQIKGVAGNLHILKVFETAAQLEAELRRSDGSFIAETLDSFSYELGRFADEIAVWHKTAENQKPIDIDRNDAKISIEAVNETVVLCDRLIDFLEANNWQAEDCLEEVVLRMSGGHAQELARIKNYLTDLEFAAAADCVRDLRDRLRTPF